MSFTPALFSKFAKNASDLLSKKFNYNTEAVFKTNATDGTKFEATLSQASQGAEGNLKVTRNFVELGKVELESGTTGASKVKLEVTKLHDNTKVIVKADESPKGSLSVEFAQDAVAIEASVNASQKATSVSFSAAMGMDGFGIGGSADYDVSGGNLSDVNGGVQYESNDFTATLKSTNHMEKLQGSYYHRVSNDVELAAELGYNLSNNARSLTVGGSWKVDGNTLYKAKVDTSGTLESVFRHRLPNPAILYNLTCKHDLNSKSTQPTEYGISLTFGDTSD